jgi:hypothetical protein
MEELYKIQLLRHGKVKEKMLKQLRKPFKKEL